MFIDDKAKNIDEDDNYFGLSHDYFSYDLRMILNKVGRGDKNISEYILNYISSIYESVKCPDWKKRIDLIQPVDTKVFK